MKNYLRNAFEEIDAAVFSGDDMQDQDTRNELVTYVGRWLKELNLNVQLAAPAEPRVLMDVIMVKCGGRFDIDLMSPTDLLQAISDALEEMKQ